VNILHDINVCLIALVYMGCLVFVQTLEHSGLRLGKLSLSMRRCHFWPKRLCLRRDDGAVKLQKSPAIDELRIRLMFEIANKVLWRSKPIGFC
jgi:hypothetical protein